MLSMLVMCLSAGHAISKNEAEADSPDAAAWVKNLSHPSYQERETASRELWILGEEVRPLLEEASKSKNPETAYRAREILHKLDLFIRPDTEPELVKLIEEYRSASADDRRAIFQQIRALRAWPQLLRLYATETDDYIRKTYAPSMSAIAMQSAREEILKGNPKAAIELLKMAPSDEKSLNALAFFHYVNGSIQDEWNKAKAGEGKDAAQWRLALARAMGDLGAAIRAAELADERPTSAALAALNGDPIPWLMIAGELPRNEHNDIYPLYLELARKRWLGQELDDLLLRELSGKLISSSTRVKSLAMNSLFLLGRSDLAEPAFAKSSPINAFRHYLALERIDEALDVLGLNKDVSKNLEWVNERIRSLKSEQIDEGLASTEQTEELVAYLGFLESRGLTEEAYQLCRPALLELAEKHDSVFVELMASLMVQIGGCPVLSFRLGTDWAGDNEGRWDDFRLEVFDADGNGERWWRWMAKLDPNAQFADRMRGLMSLYRMGPDPKRLRDRWVDLAWKHIDADGEERDELVNLLSQLETNVGHVSGGLKAWEALPDDQKNVVYWGQRVVHLSAANRWAEAADTILNMMDDAQKAGRTMPAELYAYAASALRKAGRLDEAKEYDKWVNQLALGQPDTMRQIANGYVYGLDFERANLWWERMAFFADPEEDDYESFMQLYGDSLMHQGQWARAAAVMELVTSAHAESNYRFPFPLTYTHQRLKADMCRGLSQLDDDRAGAIELLRECHREYMTDGVLADFFYPSLRKEGLIKYHDEWFALSWAQFEKSMKRFPGAHNTANTAAWFASRAQRQLDKSEVYLKSALVQYPYQPAYLDTMAEIQFAKGNRAEALKWSNMSINYSPGEEELRRQHHHFLTDPLPK